MSKKLALAYSGGLDTTVILHWLVQKGYDVTAILVNLGQKCEDQAKLMEKAKLSGASDLHWLDVSDEFVRDYVFPAVWANALYEGRYYLGTSLARPLIAKTIVDVMNKIGATVAAHGATGKGNDQVRFELTFYALKPEIEIFAPWRDREFQAAFQGRTDMIDYTVKHNLPVAASAKKPYSMDDNLLHISYEAGILEDPNFLLEKDNFLRTTDPAKAPDKAERVKITFEKGNPVAVDGKTLAPAALLDTLNVIAGKHGIGRVDMVESRYVGMKSRGVYETPGGTLLYFAHRDLEGMALTGQVIADKEMLMPLWAQRVYQGYWF
ncbi:MAG: argininosuccinate synthase, partial [Planctomycetota bacterium]